MSYILFNSGEEAMMRVFYDNNLSKPSSVDVGLYHDATDNLSDTDDVGSITTEPQGSKYTRQSVSFGSEMTVIPDSNDDWMVQLNDTVFDVSDSSQTVDGGFVVLNYQRNNDSTGGDHLLFTVELDQETNLGQINGTITLQDTSLSLD